MDLTRDSNGDALFILDPPDDDKGGNESHVNKHLGSQPNEGLGLNLKKPILSDAVVTETNDKKIKRNSTVSVKVQGENLVATLYLEDSTGNTKRYAKTLFATETDPNTHYSDVKEVHIVFENITDDPSTGWKLFGKNSGGTSNAITGFEIINP